MRQTFLSVSHRTLLTGYQQQRDGLRVAPRPDRRTLMIGCWLEGKWDRTGCWSAVRWDMIGSQVTRGYLQRFSHSMLVSRPYVAHYLQETKQILIDLHLMFLVLPQNIAAFLS